MFDASVAEPEAVSHREVSWPPCTVSAHFVCRIAIAGRGWRRRDGDVHVVVIADAEGVHTQICRVPPSGRDVFIERILPGCQIAAARAWALHRFGRVSTHAAATTP